MIISVNMFLIQKHLANLSFSIVLDKCQFQENHYILNMPFFEMCTQVNQILCEHLNNDIHVW